MTTDVSVEDYYENAPCGLVIAWPDGRIARVNATLAEWLGHDPAALIGIPFTDLLSVGGRIYYETHFSPLLQSQGSVSGIAVDLVAAGGTRLPVFVTANVQAADDGRPALLRITAQDASDRRSYERELLDARQAADRERARVHELATTLQRSLIPPTLFPPAGLEAAAYYHPASADDVGGDFYDLFPLSHQRWGFFLGDVSGKGAGAAAVTSLTRYTLRAAAVYDADPVAVLHNLNRVLSHEFHGDDPRFCTVLFGILEHGSDTQGGFDVDVASGGHPPALLLRTEGRAEYVDTAGGQAVGMVAEARFVSTRFTLAPGDTMLLYTDGLTEARTGIGIERYDDDNALLEFAAARAPSTAVAVVDAIRSLLTDFGSGLQDDVAVMALGVPRF